MPDNWNGASAGTNQSERERETHEKRPTLRTWAFSGRNGPRAFLADFVATCKRVFQLARRLEAFRIRLQRGSPRIIRHCQLGVWVKPLHCA